MNVNGHVPLVVVRRGESVDTLHIGSIAVVDADGRVLGAAGNVRQPVFIRSGAKPFQALPVVEAGAADRFGFTPRELAIMTGSHGGEPIHQEVVGAILARAGLDAGRLRCGTHPPFHKETGEDLVRTGQTPTVLHNNCSGKHAGMLALASHLEADLETYPEPEHPVQQLCLEALAGCCDTPPQEIFVARDGCGVPTYTLPLWKAAHGYARLIDPRGLPDRRAAALRRIATAMLEHPLMVGGTGRLCTDLMQEFRSRLLVKIGAHGFIAAGFRRGGAGVGIGVAIKMADGNSGPIRAAAILEALQQSGEFEAGRLTPVRRRHVPDIRTLLSQPAGHVEPVFRLQKE